MDTTELRRALKKAAKRRGVRYDFEPGPGKGSHGRVRFGDRFTHMPTHGEIGKGLLHKILRDLGLTKGELR